MYANKYIENTAFNTILIRSVNRYGYLPLLEYNKRMHRITGYAKGYFRMLNCSDVGLKHILFMKYSHGMNNKYRR